MENPSVQKQSFFSKAFNIPALQKSRMHWVDYLKGIAIILVVYRHSFLGIQSSGIAIPNYLYTANTIFFSFRMPLFFMLSGIFISKSLAKRSVAQFIENKFETLMYPYFIWVVIQITLQIFLSSFTNSQRSLIDYTYIFYQPRNLDQFWYLPALFNCAVVFVVVKKYINGKWWFQLPLGIIFYFLSPHLQNISMLSDWMGFYIFFAIGDAISQVFFHPKVQNLFKNYITLICAVPVFVVAQMFYLKYQPGAGKPEFIAIALVGCFTMLCVAFLLQRSNTFSFLRIIGYHSLIIYVMHVMIAALIRITLVHVFHLQNPFMLLVICIACGSVFPVMIYNLFIYRHPLWFLFTYKKEKSKPKQKEINPAATSAIIQPEQALKVSN